jgi:hypothetical protein
LIFASGGTNDKMVVGSIHGFKSEPLKSQQGEKMLYMDGSILVT